MILRSSAKDPADVRPPDAIARAVWIFVRVGMGVVQTMCRDPCDRSRLQAERTAGRQKPRHPFRRCKSAMREQTVIADANTPTSGYPPAYKRGQCILPAKREQRRYGRQMKCGNKNDRIPI